MHTIYTSGTSFIHRLHPLTKLAAAGALIVATYIIPSPLVPAAIFGIVIVLAWQAGVAGAILRTVALVVLPIALSLFIIQGILFPPPGSTPLPIGPVTLTREGPLLTYLISARLLVLSSTVLLLLRTTHPADLVSALTERGLPRSIGYILLVSLQIIPDMAARATAILEAQRSRGLETQGRVRRLRAIIPLLGPLVVGALVDVEDRAMAIESRAFMVPGPKTSLRVLVDTPAQRVARLCLLLLIAALVVARFTIFWEVA
jgi:energy-coupling factor transport system permease protein